MTDDHDHDPEKVVSHEMFVNARKNKLSRSAVVSVGNKRRRESLLRLHPPFDFGQFSYRQQTEAGKLEAFLRATELLSDGVAAARLLTPGQFGQLLVVLAKLDRLGCEPTDARLTEIAEHLLAARSGPALISAAPDDDVID